MASQNPKFEVGGLIGFVIQHQRVEVRIDNISYDRVVNNQRTVDLQGAVLISFRLEWKTDYRREKTWDQGQWIEIRLNISPQGTFIEFPFTQHEWIPTPQFRLE